MDLQGRVHPVTKQANYCCIPFVSKFFWKVYLSSSSLVSSYMLLNVPHPFCSPWNATQVTPDSCSKVSLCMPDSHFNNLRCHCLLSCCGAVSFYLPWLSLLALSYLSVLSENFLDLFWIFCGPSSSKTIFSSVYSLSLSLKSKQIGSTKTIWSFASLKLSWASFIWNKICVFSSAVCSCLTT